MLDRISLAGRSVEYCVIPSKFATKLRVRVGMAGVEVIRPQDRDQTAISNFLRANASWILTQLDRVKRFHGIRRPNRRGVGQILFRGESVAIQVQKDAQRAGSNRIVHSSGGLLILSGSDPVTPPARSLENWLRKQARTEILTHLDTVTSKLKRQPGKVLVMGQRTKWGNCSALGNLSFNWRLIMAPELVLRYLVTHEAVHLAIPDHSQKFWLSVRSLCPETERAKQWLSRNGHQLLLLDLRQCVTAVPR